MQSGPKPRFVVHQLPALKEVNDPKRMVRRFVGRVGGIDNARRALDFLALLEGVRQEDRREAA